jgi:hypothetical protein
MSENPPEKPVTPDLPKYLRDPLEKHSRTVEEVLNANQRERREFIKEWAEYVRTHPDDDWAAQVNTLVDAQLESARQLEDVRPDLDEIDSSLLED